MKGSLAVAKQAQAMTTQTEEIAEIHRKINLVMESLGIADGPTVAASPPEPDPPGEEEEDDKEVTTLDDEPSTPRRPGRPKGGAARAKK